MFVAARFDCGSETAGFAAGGDALYFRPGEEEDIAGALDCAAGDEPLAQFQDGATRRRPAAQRVEVDIFAHGRAFLRPGENPTEECAAHREGGELLEGLHSGLK